MLVCVYGSWRMACTGAKESLTLTSLCVFVRARVCLCIDGCMHVFALCLRCVCTVCHCVYVTVCVCVCVAHAVTLIVTYPGQHSLAMANDCMRRILMPWSLLVEQFSCHVGVA